MRARVRVRVSQGKGEGEGLDRGELKTFTSVIYKCSYCLDPLKQ